MTPSLRARVLRDWQPLRGPASDPRPAAALRQLVPQVMDKLGLDQRLWESQIFHRWADFVGPINAQICQPASLRHGKLTVTVTNSAYIQELRPLKPQMLERIQQRVGKQHVRDIIFRNG